MRYVNQWWSRTTYNTALQPLYDEKVVDRKVIAIFSRKYLKTHIYTAYNIIYIQGDLFISFYIYYFEKFLLY